MLNIKLQAQPDPKWQTLLEVELNAESSSTLVERVEEAKTRTEIVTTLGNAGRDFWTVYWKQREGDSRCLLAHPEADRWVLTVALEAGPFDQMLQKLRGRADFRIDELASLNRVSNASVRFTFV